MAARFRKISMVMHADAKYQALSSPPPNGKSLWMHLIAGPSTGIIPGLTRIGQASMAEELDWPLEGFLKAFQEVSEKGMAKADWKARLVWVPNAIRHNEPESPNVIIGWGKAWDEIPQCKLKDIAFTALREHVDGMGKGFQEAFRKAFAKGWLNQEQEQEQEQEHEQDKNLPSGTDVPVGLVGVLDLDSSSAPPPAVNTLVKEFWNESWKTAHGTDFCWGTGKRSGASANGTALAAIMQTLGCRRETPEAGQPAFTAAERKERNAHNLELLPKIKRVITAFMEDPSPFYDGHPPMKLKAEIHKFIGRAEGNLKPATERRPPERSADRVAKMLQEHRAQKAGAL